MLITYNIDYIIIHNIITNNTNIRDTWKLFLDRTFCASSEQEGVHCNRSQILR